MIIPALRAPFPLSDCANHQSLTGQQPASMEFPEIHSSRHMEKLPENQPTASIRGLMASDSCRLSSLATSVQILRDVEHKPERLLAVHYLVHHMPLASRQRFGTALRCIPHGGIRTVDGRR